MTRPSSSGSGLPDTDPFPDNAKETARYIGMPEDALRIGHRVQTKVAGVSEYDWFYDDAIRGRIDPLGAVGGAGRLSGGQIDATSTHTATFDDPQEISSQDRIIEVNTDTIWTVNAIRVHSDQDVVQVEVRQLVT